MNRMCPPPPPPPPPLPLPRHRTPAIPESPEDLSEEELEALQQQMDEDFELATGEQGLREVQSVG
jgi:hypothetical protein